MSYGWFVRGKSYFIKFRKIYILDEIEFVLETKFISLKEDKLLKKPRTISQNEFF